MSDTASNPSSTQAPQPGLSNAVLALVAVVILAILGGGGWLVYAKVITTDSTTDVLPATVLPASTVAFVTVDANPSLSQKVDLLKVLGKFPALKSKVTIGAQDDPRKWVIEQILKSTCPSLSFAKDFAPWVGDHVALGAVDVGATSPAPVAALQARDGGAAISALKKMTACAKSKDFIFATSGGYVVASDSRAHLDKILTAAKTAPLSADATYRTWAGRFDADGIVRFYVAPSAVELLAKAVGSGQPQVAQQFKKALGSFRGMVGYLGATNDGLEFKMAIGSKALSSGTATLGTEIANLPADTALALGFGVAPSWSKKLSSSFLAGFGQGLSAGGRTLPSTAQFESMVKQYTGLSVPGDLATLLGKAVVLSVGGTAPADLAGLQSPFQLPIGLKIDGDPAKIRAVVAKIEAKVGGTLEHLGFTSRTRGSDYIVATNATYAQALAGSGSLGTDPTFLAAVANPDRAQGIFFLRFDSAWRTAIIKLLARTGMPDERQVLANTAPLSALGVSQWTDGDAAIVDVKLTTK